MRFRVPGYRDPSLPTSGIEGNKAGLFEIRPREAFRIDRSRSVGGGDLVEVPDEGLVEIELEGGVKLWSSASRIRELLPSTAARGVAGDIEIPLELPLGSATRGVSKSILKALKVFDIDPAGKLAKMTAEAIAAKLEEKLKPGAGLYRWREPELSENDRISPEGISPDQPYLLFIHGTASTSRESFNGLWEKKVFPKLFEVYPDRILAFEHRTLSRSPISNAVELVGALPNGARLHLVTHSRGGLVGELLCRGAMEGGGKPFTEEEQKLFQGENYRAEMKQLQELNKLLTDRKIQVERFVRVACPAAGTLLADGRLDQYFSILTNLVGLIPALKATPAYEFLTGFLGAVIKKRAEPQELPGLEAMMPSSPLIRLLNPPGRKVDGNVAIIGGDIEAAGILQSLYVFATNLYYREDHDLVVNTKAMLGGGTRMAGTHFFLKQSPEISHFQYFTFQETRERLLDALQGKIEGFEAGKAGEPVTEPVYRGQRGKETAPIVYLIPGLMGNRLTSGEELLWPGLEHLSEKGLSRLRINERGIEAGGVLGPPYRDLANHLATTHQVIPFPYDWRRSLLETARPFAEKLEATLRETGEEIPVRILAHSAGGLLALAAMAERPDLWDRFCRRPECRLILLGAPTRGTYFVPRLLTGRERLTEQLLLLDPKLTRQEVLETFSQYPGLLELLPTGGKYDFFRRETWEELRQTENGDWPLPDEAALRAARVLQEVIGKRPLHSERILYVAGLAPATPASVDIDPKADPHRRLRFVATSRGDGRVCWETGPPPGVKTWFLPADHGNLANHEPEFPALLDLLQRGESSRLTMIQPATARGRDEEVVLPPDRASIFPDQEEIAAAALGTESWKRRKGRRAAQVEVTVVHGNLAFAEHPVAVGHYLGDTIISAEAHLDRALEGRLSARHRLGLYPGAPDSSEIFLDDGKTPPGAVVIGLGRVGELTPGILTENITRASLKYALAWSESPDATDATRSKQKSAGISALLIGTGAGGLSIEDSLSALLRGVCRANRALEEGKFAHRVRIGQLEIIELYEDRVIQASRTLLQLAQNAEFMGMFRVRPEIRCVPGSQRRIAYEEAPGWWRHLQVMSGKDGSLEFNALTDRARSEVSLQPTQRALVDRFIEQAVGRPQSNPRLTSTLFELLLPNRLKEQAPTRQNLVVVLDDASARYPWELLQDRGARPFAVDAGLSRQLKTEVFREKVVMTTRRTALVVGDPPAGSKDFPILYAAQREANRVAELLRENFFDVVCRVAELAAAEEVISALFADDYRILHLAGHGVYRYCPSPEERICEICKESHECKDEEKGVTGMVLGNGIYLTPAEIRQMRQVPELAFINCCYLGKVEDEENGGWNDRHKLAANLGSELIRMGVRAVVAAGWAVDDLAAATFAEEFYRQMLQGTPFGEAVRQARALTYQNHGEVNTWGAYQCYGDPAYRLVNRSRAPSPGQEEEYRFLTEEEAITELDNITSRALTAPPQEAAGLQKRVGRIWKGLPESWRKKGGVLAAMGRAFAELDRFEEAVKHYRSALEAEKADLPVRTIEQLANLESRLAVMRHKNPGKDKEGAGELLDKSLERIRLLLDIAPTSERYSLLGSAWKRKAIISEGEERINALREMTEAYRKAHETALERDKRINPYPRHNHLLGLLLLSWYGVMNLDRMQFEKDLAEVGKIAADRDKESPDFWNGIAVTENNLLRHLESGELVSRPQEITDGYRKARMRSASPREFRSVMEQFDFLEEVVKVEEHEDLVKALRGIREELGK